LPDVAVRLAGPDDIAPIRAVVAEAFAASSLGHQGEAALVSRLFTDGDIDVAVVAEAAGAIVGAAIFSPMRVVADGIPLRASALAPVAVVSRCWRQGIGGRLIRAGLERLSSDGVAISFVLGHPDYYPRFGYDADLARPYRSPYAGPHFMAAHLDKTCPVPASGSADYARAFAPSGDA
jgi:putative acetyltransferase